jgi:hypothetical protein
MTEIAVVFARAAYIYMTTGGEERAATTDVEGRCGNHLI